MQIRYYDVSLYCDYDMIIQQTKNTEMTTIANITNQIENDFFELDYNLEDERYQLTDEQAEEMPEEIKINNGTLYISINRLNRAYVYGYEIFSRVTVY